MDVLRITVELLKDGEWQWTKGVDVRADDGQAEITQALADLEIGLKAAGHSLLDGFK